MSRPAHSLLATRPLTAALSRGYAGRALAKGLLVGVVAAVLGSGCLWPVEDPVLEDLPPRKNRPPRILEQNVVPQRRTTIGNGIGCKLEFKAQVEDPDLNDLLVVRWYIDYDPLSNPSPFGLESSLPPDGNAIRSTSATLTVELSSPGHPLRVPGDHMVELLVSDGRLINRDPQPVATEGFDGGNPTFASSYPWFVTVEAGDCCDPQLEVCQ
jgi:hypothetical protein